MKKDKAMQLVAALQSGEYEQGQGKLVDDRDRFCCLGVVCNISDSKLEWNQPFPDLWWEIGGNRAHLPPSIQKEFGFYSRHGARRDNKYIIINKAEYGSLTGANDQGVSHYDIGEYVKNNYQYL